jgi:hypothetical protein
MRHINTSVHRTSAHISMLRSAGAIAILFALGLPASGAPNCDLPDDIVEWVQDRTVTEIVAAWPPTAKQGRLWAAFLAVSQNSATPRQVLLVKGCTG